MDMPNIQFNSSSLLSSTFRDESRGGKDYLVVKGVAVVEGVLKKELLTKNEIHANEWNDVPLVLRHPQKNGGSAKTANPDVPVLGRFYGAKFDTNGNRLLGEFWLDKTALNATPEGAIIEQKVRDGEVIEVSTGYYTERVNQRGVWKGSPYTVVQTNVKPDHIAILPDQIGACSVVNGCGMSRNDSDCGCDEGVNMDRPVFSPNGYEIHLTRNDGDGTDDEASESLDDKINEVGQAFMKLKYPSPSQTITGYIQKVYDDHVIVEDGDNLYSVPYTTDANGDIQFTERSLWAPVELQKKYVPVSANSAGADKPQAMKAMWDKVYQASLKGGDDNATAAKKAMGACKNAGWMQDDSGKWMMKKTTKNDTGAVQAVTISEHRADGRTNPKKEKRPMDATLAKVLAVLGVKTSIVQNEDGSTDSTVVLETPAPAQTDPLVALNASLKDIGGVEGLVALVKSNAEQIASIAGTVQNAQTMIANQQAREDSDKAGLIAEMAANTSCPFGEDELKAKSLAEVTKLHALVTRAPVDYRARGGAAHNADGKTPYRMPSVLLAGPNATQKTQ
jgi:hypothetical protein